MLSNAVMAAAVIRVIPSPHLLSVSLVPYRCLRVEQRRVISSVSDPDCNMSRVARRCRSADRVAPTAAVSPEGIECIPLPPPFRGQSAVRGDRKIREEEVEHVSPNHPCPVAGRTYWVRCDAHHRTGGVGSSEG